MPKRLERTQKRFRSKEVAKTNQKFQELERERKVKEIVESELRKWPMEKKEPNELLYYVTMEIIGKNPHISALNKRKLAENIAHDIRLGIAVRKAKNGITHSPALEKIINYAAKQLQDPACVKVLGFEKKFIEELMREARVVKALNAEVKGTLPVRASFLGKLGIVNEKFAAMLLGSQSKEVRQAIYIAVKEVKKIAGQE